MTEGYMNFESKREPIEVSQSQAPSSAIPVDLAARTMSASTKEDVENCLRSYGSKLGALLGRPAVLMFKVWKLEARICLRRLGLYLSAAFEARFGRGRQQSVHLWPKIAHTYRDLRSIRG
jgi:hypothetical protein